MTPDLFDIVTEIVTKHYPQEGRLLRDVGQQLKREGMDRAAAQVPTLLAKARGIALDLAHLYGFVTIDDVRARLSLLESDLLGNAAGSLFKPKERWIFVDWVPSVRPSNHGRMIRRWALRP